MKNNTSANRYIYHTSGVCPPEIHFKINDGKINDLRFVGGGCPGNAQLVSRLLEGKSLAHVLSDIQGIDCRNGTSCPQELACAIRAVQNGTLDIAESFKVQADSIPRQSLAVIGNPAGDSVAFETILKHILDYDVDAILCLGNLTGDSIDQSGREEIKAVQNLAPGDYKVVRDRYSFHPKSSINHILLINALENEAKLKTKHEKANRIGFK